jgi:(2Fe-2S) ferredoxin
MQIHHFFVCTNERTPDTMMPSCKPQGGQDVFEEFVREIGRRGYPEGLKVTSTGCLTPCQIGPNVVVYPLGVWYAGVNRQDVREIIDAHLAGKTVDRLLKPREVRVW